MEDSQSQKILRGIQKAASIHDFRSVGYLAADGLTIINGTGDEVDIALVEIDKLIAKIEIEYEARCLRMADLDEIDKNRK